MCRSHSCYSKDGADDSGAVRACRARGWIGVVAGGVGLRRAFGDFMALERIAPSEKNQENPDQARALTSRHVVADIETKRPRGGASWPPSLKKQGQSRWAGWQAQSIATCTRALPTCAS